MEDTLVTEQNNRELLNRAKTYKTRLSNNITFSSLELNNKEQYKKLTLHIGDYCSTLTIDKYRLLLSLSVLESNLVIFEWQQSDEIQPPNPDCIIICDNTKMSIMAMELGFLTFYDCFQACLNVSMKISDNEKVTKIIE